MKHNKSNKNTFTKSEAKEVREWSRYYGSYETAAKNILHTKAKKAVEFCQEIERRLSYSDWLQLSEHERTNFEFFAKVKQNMEDFAALLPSSGYSMGETKVVSAKGLPSGRYDNTKEYARSCRYRATHGKIYAEIPVEYAVKGLSLGGFITIIGLKVRGNIYHCKWLEINQIKNYCKDCKVVEKKGFGFYYIDIFNTKRFYHAATYAEAVAACKKSQTAEKKYKKDKKSKKKNAAIWQAVTTKDMKALKLAVGAAKLKKLYNFGDSLNAGNCRAGTLNFFRLCGYDRNESATGADIISRAFRFAPDTLNYMVKIFLYK